MAEKKVGHKDINIKPPNFQEAVFKIRSMDNSPLVVHRFSTKVAEDLRNKQAEGPSAKSKKHREAKDWEVVFNEARYRSKDGWDGFNATSIRKAMISACRLVNFKMTLAKLSLFVVQDGWDAQEPQIPLIRIHNSEPVQQFDMGVTSTGVAMPICRPAYHNWEANVRIRWDGDQFTVDDVTNLLMRVGLQVGVGEGRNDSKNSAGMGWGSFEVVGAAVVA